MKSCINYSLKFCSHIFFQSQGESRKKKKCCWKSVLQFYFPSWKRAFLKGKQYTNVMSLGGTQCQSNTTYSNNSHDYNFKSKKQIPML